ncbi:MAG: aspartyl/asparaginyl beta-hydroxylase domain-containing protein [Vitreimonas sp.]
MNAAARPLRPSPAGAVLRADRSSNMPDAAKLRSAFDPMRLQADLSALHNYAPLRQPGRYHDGEWVGHTLRSAGGRISARPSMPGLRDYEETRLLEHAPYMREVLATLACPQLCVRVLCLPPGGVIREHVDDVFGFWSGILRLHIPIVTHPRVNFMLAGRRRHWRPGELWYGDFSLPHSVRNESDVIRAHLVIDVLVNEFILSQFPDARDLQAYTPAPVIIEIEESRLAEYACELVLPTALLAALWPKALKRLWARKQSPPAPGLAVCLRASANRLVAWIGTKPFVSLAPIGDDVFMLCGWTAGVLVRLSRTGGRVSAAQLRVRTNRSTRGTGPKNIETHFDLAVL